MKFGICLFLILLQTAIAHAEITAESVYRNYDDTKTHVQSPSVDVSATFDDDKMKVNAGWAEDIVSSASADVVTYSSKGQMHDTRVEFSSGIEALIPDGSFGFSYVKSDEDDYHSQGFTVTATREFFQKNTVVGFAFSSGYDIVNSSMDLDFQKYMDNQLYSLSVTQILSRVSLLQLLYDFRVENGYLGSPYRRAKFIDPTSGSISSKPENQPETRNRNAWAINYNYFSEPMAVSFATTYRLYQDNWGVVSHTVEERMTKKLTKRLASSMTLRFYTQTQASFYSDYYYDSNAVFYTGNVTLANYQTYFLGIRPSYDLTDKWTVALDAEVYYENFRNAVAAGDLTTLSDDKTLQITAVVLGLGLAGKF